VNDIKSEQLVAEAHRQATRRAKLQSLKWPLMIVVPLLVLGVGAYLYVSGQRYVATDDAYIGAARTAVAASVPGRIVGVNAHENELVKKGDVLVVIDDGGYKAAVERAQAELDAARLQVQALRASYEQSMAGLNTAQASATYAEREKERQAALLKAGISSQQDYDKAAHQNDEAQLAVASAQQEVAKAQADLGGITGDNIDTHPHVAQAIAQLDRTKIDLGNTNVLAATDGVVTKVDQVQIGSYANTSQPLFWLVSKERWVEANFKENQLAHLQPGEGATITLDAYPGKKITGCVASFSPGTGSSFSLLPAENATGNWVKVAQRLPVRLEITQIPENVFLASGLSAHVSVDTQSHNDSCGRAAAP
jgi:membrane fusion protein (multidrug efflux system)